MALAVFIQFGKKVFMIKLNKNKFVFLNNNFVLSSMIITLISFPFLSYAGGASMHSPIEQFVVKKIFEIQDPFFWLRYIFYKCIIIYGSCLNSSTFDFNYGCKIC